MRKRNKQKKHIHFIAYLLTPKRVFLLLLTGLVVSFFLTYPFQKIKQVNAIVCDCFLSTGTNQLPFQTESYTGGCPGTNVIRYTLPFVDYYGTTYYTLPAGANATYYYCCPAGTC